MTDVEKIREANRARNTEIMKAMADACAESASATATHVSGALFKIAEQFRERGEELKRLKRKGHVSTKDKLDFAAEQIESVAGSLVNDGSAWTYAASEVAGVAVSLERDGAAEPRRHACAFTAEGCILDGPHYDDVCDASFLPPPSRGCTRTPGHSGAHVVCIQTPEPCDIAVAHLHDDAIGDIYMNSGAPIDTRDGEPFGMTMSTDADVYGGPPARNEDERCRSGGPDLGHRAAACILREGHEGRHTDGHGAWEDEGPRCGDIGPNEMPCQQKVDHPGDHVAGHRTETGVACHQWPRAEDVPELYEGQCEAESIGQRCMLSGGHTGVHIDRRGGRWPQAAAELKSAVKADVKAIMQELRGDSPIGIASVRRSGTAVLDAPLAVIPAQYCHECGQGGHTCKGCGGTTTHEAPHACADANCPGHPAYVDTRPFDVSDPAVDWSQDCPAFLEEGFGDATNARCRLPLNHGGGHSLNTFAELATPDATASSTLEAMKVPQSPTGFTLPYPLIEAPGLTPAGYVSPVTTGPTHTLPAGMVITGAAPHVSPLGLPVDLSAHAPGTPKPYQSVSSIETMGDCGLKYRYQYRDGLKQTPAWWNAGGSAFHAYAEWVEKLLFNTSHEVAVHMLDSLVSSVSGKYRALLDEEVAKLSGESGTSPEKWRTAAKGKEGGAWWLENGTTMAALYLTNRAEWGREHQLVMMPDGSPAVEVGFTVDFGGVPVKGYIDQAWWGVRAGALVIRDLKAGARKPAGSFQLGVYDKALRGMITTHTPDTAPPRAAGSYYMARKAEDVAVEPGRSWSRESIAYRAQTTAAADAAGTFIARPSEFCVACPFREICPVSA